MSQKSLKVSKKATRKPLRRTSDCKSRLFLIRSSLTCKISRMIICLRRIKSNLLWNRWRKWWRIQKTGSPNSTHSTISELWTSSTLRSLWRTWSFSLFSQLNLLKILDQTFQSALWCFAPSFTTIRRRCRQKSINKHLLTLTIVFFQLSFWEQFTIKCSLLRRPRQLSQIAWPTACSLSLS